MVGATFVGLRFLFHDSEPLTRTSHLHKRTSAAIVPRISPRFPPPAQPRSREAPRAAVRAARQAASLRSGPRCRSVRPSLGGRAAGSPTGPRSVCCRRSISCTLPEAAWAPAGEVLQDVTQRRLHRRGRTRRGRPAPRRRAAAGRAGASRISRPGHQSRPTTASIACLRPAVSNGFLTRLFMPSRGPCRRSRCRRGR